MNGEINPNANRMGGFGKGKNYMQQGGNSNVNMADLLPKDPYAEDPNQGRGGRWLKQSEQKHQEKQAKLAAEQDQFVPESFKRSGAMNLDIKNNKSKGKETTWVDNNSKLDSSNPNDPQNQNQNNYGGNNNNYNNMNNNNNNNYGNNNNMNNNNQNNGGFSYGNNNNNNNNNNQQNNKNQNNNGGFPYGNNNMNNNNNSGDNDDKKFNNNFNNQNNGGYNGNNNNMNNNNFGNNNNNNNNMGGFNNNQNMNNYGNNNMNNNMNNNNNNMMNNKTENNKIDPNINRPKGPMEQPVPQPYYSGNNKDPFAKFLDNSSYQRDLKNHGRNQSSYNQPIGNKPNYKPYGSKANNNKAQNGDNFHSGNKESKNWLGTDNKFSQPIRSKCYQCGKAVQDSWTEDAQQRMYHNECFICCECGIPLGQLGKYVTIGKGVVCKPCRNKQVLAAQAAEQY